MKTQLLTAILGLAIAAPSFAQSYDLVLQGGRAIDPETGLDATRSIGISSGKIARISASLQGKRILDAKGLVISPGFIDVHQHGQDADSGRIKAFDGVTTALEMEIGSPDVAAFLQEKDGRAFINYGATASHCAARAAAFGSPLAHDAIIPASGPATNQPASDQQIAQIKERLNHELAAGALGIGMGIQYTPGATRLEVIEMFRLAAAHHVPVFTHIRSAGRVEPGSSIESVSEVIAAAAISGASLQIVHINSSCMKDGIECISLVAGARARGIDVTTEAYPYVAGMTFINSALFNPGWQQKFGIDYGALQLPQTGEYLNKDRFDELHGSPKSQTVLMYLNTQATVDTIISNPLVMIASDGERDHPRNAGSYSHILARYVRELRALTLQDAIRKMSLMPAQRLEKSALAARRKGRLQEGADADVIAFDPATIQDRSTYQNPALTSTGMQFVIVNGTLLIDRGTLVTGVHSGKALVGDGS